MKNNIFDFYRQSPITLGQFGQTYLHWPATNPFGTTQILITKSLQRLWPIMRKESASANKQFSILVNLPVDLRHLKRASIRLEL